MHARHEEGQCLWCAVEFRLEIQGALAQPSAIVILEAGQFELVTSDRAEGKGQVCESDYISGIGWVEDGEIGDSQRERKAG